MFFKLSGCLKVTEWFNDLINTIGLSIHFLCKVKLVISVKKILSLIDWILNLTFDVFGFPS